MASNDASVNNAEENVQPVGQNSAAAGGTSTAAVPEGEQGDRERPTGNSGNATQNVAKGGGTADSQTKTEEMGRPGHALPEIHQPHTSEEHGDGMRTVCPSSDDYSSSGASSVNPALPQGAAQPQIPSAWEASTREQPILGSRVPVQETHAVVTQTERGDNMESASISRDLHAQFQWSEDGLEITQIPPVMESVGHGIPSRPRSPDPSQSLDSSVTPQYEFAEGGLGLSGAAPVAEQGDAAPSNMASNDVDLNTGRSCLHCEKWPREVLLPCGHKNLCYQCFFCKTFWCHHLQNGQPWCLVCGLPYTDIYDRNLHLQALIYNDRRQRVTRCGCYCRSA